MTAPSKTGCEQVERIAEYALQALPASEKPALHAHVQECAECQQELEALRAVVETFVDWPTDVLRSPTPLWAQLSRRIAETTGSDPQPVADTRWVDEPPWREVAPGISCKLLATDEVTGYVSMLVRLAPGVAYPSHTHAAVEELHLLDGELWIEDRKLYPGDYNRAEPGTGDVRVYSETGCTCVLMTSGRDILG